MKTVFDVIGAPAVQGQPASPRSVEQIVESIKDDSLADRMRWAARLVDHGRPKAARAIAEMVVADLAVAASADEGR